MKITKIDFTKNPKVLYYTDEMESYEDFVDEWNECHTGEEPPAEDSMAYWDEVNFMRQLNYEDFCGNFQYSPLCGRLCLVHGYFGGWQGHEEGGKVYRIDSVEDLTRCVSGHADQMEVFTDSEGLHIRNAHHDGTDFYTVYPLTKEGEEWWDENGTDCRKDHQYLLDNGLTEKVDYYLF